MMKHSVLPIFGSALIVAGGVLAILYVPDASWVQLYEQVSVHFNSHGVGTWGEKHITMPSMPEGVVTAWAPVGGGFAPLFLNGTIPPNIIMYSTITFTPLSAVAILMTVVVPYIVAWIGLRLVEDDKTSLVVALAWMVTAVTASVTFVTLMVMTNKAVHIPTEQVHFTLAPVGHLVLQPQSTGRYTSQIVAIQNVDITWRIRHAPYDPLITQGHYLFCVYDQSCTTFIHNAVTGGLDGRAPVDGRVSPLLIPGCNTDQNDAEYPAGAAVFLVIMAIFGGILMFLQCLFPMIHVIVSCEKLRKQTRSVNVEIPPK